MRIDKARELIDQKEAEIAGVKIQIHDIYEQYADERNKAARFQQRIQYLERENKALEVRFMAEAEEKVRLKEDES